MFRLSVLGLVISSSLLSLGVARAQPEAPAVKVVQVLVARTDIPPGTVVLEPETLFKVVRYVQGDEPKQAFTAFAQVRGRTTRRPLAEDQPVKQRDLVSAVGRPAEAPAALPPGTRALALKYTPDEKAGGFIAPGSRVDIQVLVKEGDLTEAKDVVANVLVLAVSARGGSSNISTVAVTPEQARALAAAAAKGSFRLVRRKPESR
jgi:Flp pilus assembly protein CpaB